MKNTLSRKVLVLVAVPVIFEIILAYTLVSKLNIAEEKRATETHRRELISHVNSIVALYMLRATDLVMTNVTGDESFRQKAEKSRNRIVKHLEFLKDLAERKDPDASRWKEQCLVLLPKLDKGLTTLRQTYDEGDRIKGTRLWFSMQRSIEKIIDMLAPESTEAQSAGIDLNAEYDRLRIMIYGSILASLVIAFFLAGLFNRSTTDRLNRLRESANRLAAGQEPGARLRGDDELAEIDATLLQMHRDLLAARQRERAILDNAADAICSIDANFRFVEANRAASKLWGLSQEELLLMPVQEVVVQSYRDALVAHFQKAFSEGKPERFECQNITRDGTLVDTAWSITFAPEEKVLSCLVQDVTSRKELERMKREFVAMVSHDLRTPLTSIRLTLDMAEEEGRELLDPIVVKALVNAQTSTGRLLSLINNLLDLEKLESGSISLVPDIVPLSDCVNSSIGGLEAIARTKDIALESNVEPSCMAFADSERVEQVLVNLISNSLKFSPQGSTIVIDAIAEGDFIRVQVTDQGRGIPADLVDKIFERFKQVQKTDERKGTGLGLAICKVIVDGHGGKIGVSSQEGAGSTFWFTLPANEQTLNS